MAINNTNNNQNGSLEFNSDIWKCKIIVISPNFVVALTIAI